MSEYSKHKERRGQCFVSFSRYPFFSSPPPPTQCEPTHIYINEPPVGHYLANFALLDHDLDLFLFPDFDRRGVAHHAPVMIYTQRPDRQENTTIHENVDDHKENLNLGGSIHSILFRGLSKRRNSQEKKMPSYLQYLFF